MPGKIATSMVMVTALLIGSQVRAADQHFVRFLHPEGKSLKLAWAHAAIVNKARVRLRFGIGGRGVVVAEVVCGDQRQLLATQPDKAYQKLSTRLQLEVGANLVEVYTYRQDSRVKRHATWIVRMPPRGDPPAIALFKQHPLQGSELVRGLVLGHGLQALAVQTEGMDEALVLDGKLNPRKTSHEFVTQVELKPEENRVCFVARTNQGMRGLRCLKRQPNPAAQTRALVVVPQIDREESRTAASYFGADIEVLRTALHTRVAADGDLVVLTGRSATAGQVVERWQALLARSHPNDTLLLVYLGGLDDDGMLALLPSHRNPERTLRVSPQTLLDINSQRQEGPNMLLLLDLVDATGRSEDLPLMASGRPFCAILAAASGQSSIRSAKLGGSLFAKEVAQKLSRGERIAAFQLRDALQAAASSKSEGTQTPQMICQGIQASSGLWVPALALPAPSVQSEDAGHRPDR